MIFSSKLRENAWTLPKVAVSSQSFAPNNIAHAQTKKKEER
jgi:hypothetical protein